MNEPNALASGLSGRDFYAAKFRSELDCETEWLRRTARLKVDSIEALLRRANLAPRSVLEVGAGTGAVIGELRRRRVGSEHFAVDFSEDSVAVLKRTEPSVEVATADVTVNPGPFENGNYDLAFATHVVEHLEEPEAFLSALLDVPTSHFIAEVPLENLPFGRLKALVKDRSNHAAGHVQFFDRQSFEALLDRSGWQVVESRTYAPYLDAETLASAYGEAGLVRRGGKWLTEYALPRRLGSVWTSLYHAHHAALCVKAE